MEKLRSPSQRTSAAGQLLPCLAADEASMGVLVHGLRCARLGQGGKARGGPDWRSVGTIQCRWTGAVVSRHAYHKWCRGLCSAGVHTTNYMSAGHGSRKRTRAGEHHLGTAGGVRPEPLRWVLRGRQHGAEMQATRAGRGTPKQRFSAACIADVRYGAALSIRRGSHGGDCPPHWPAMERFFYIFVHIHLKYDQ